VTERAPLTHHEILRLVEPFTRRGRHVDLPASNRLERRLVFKPTVRDSETPAYAGAREGLQLENPRSDSYRLIRTLTLGSGAVAKLMTDGPDPGELLARIETIPLERQFQMVADSPIARSYRLEPQAERDKDQPMRMLLTSAAARLDGLTLALKAETGKGYPAEIELSPSGPQALLDDLPDDLLATLGWDWQVLRRRGTGWTSALRAPRNEPARSRFIESALDRAVAHLSRTLAEPPHRFHERFLRARWAVVFRRMIPVLSSVALIAGGSAVAYVGIPQGSLLQMVTFNFPPVLLLLLFAMREPPRFEFPPLPRPSNAPSWFPLSEAREGPDNRRQGP